MKYLHKLTVFLITIVIATGLCWFNHITGEQWTDLAKYLALFFMSANILSKAIPIFRKEK